MRLKETAAPGHRAPRPLEKGRSHYRCARSGHSRGAASAPVGLAVRGRGNVLCGSLAKFSQGVHPMDDGVSLG
jgi:hypothetical protein